MSDITLTVAGVTRTYATAREAMLALIPHLAQQDRSLQWLADAVRSTNGKPRPEATTGGREVMGEHKGEQ